MNKKIKNRLSRLGFAFFALAPILVSACANVATNQYKIMTNYNGQADLLLSLQMPPDYYPYQYHETSLRDYIKNPAKYVLVNNNTSAGKKTFQSGIDKRFDSLLSNVKTYGPSLWNDAIYNSGTARNTQFWTTKKTDLLFMERFVLDDFKTENDAAQILPAYKGLVQTNFRASRDPFTTFSAKVYNNFLNSSKSEQVTEPNNADLKIASNLRNHYNTYPNNTEPDALYRFGSYMDFWNNTIKPQTTTLQKAGFFNWIDSNTPSNQRTQEKKYTPIFYPGNEDYDEKLAKLYQKVILNSENEKEINTWIGSSGDKTRSATNNWQIAYLDFLKTVNNTAGSGTEVASKKVESATKKVKVLHHHPAFEQQVDPGSSPAAEGSQRDNMVYLFSLAAGINQYTNAPKIDNNKNLFEEDFGNDYRFNHMKNALNNTSLISQNLKTRLKNIRDYLKNIGVVDQNYDPDTFNFKNDKSKTLAIVTLPPTTGGGGNATIQTISKFAFIYSDLGLKQVLPVESSNSSSAQDNSSKAMDLDYNQANGVKYAGQDANNKGNELFNIDDNGWWWNLGDANSNTKNLNHFNKTADTVFITATDKDWNIASSGTNPYVKALETISKTYNSNDAISKINSSSYSVFHQDYGLWNEGLRSPFSTNMVLDRLVDSLQKQYDPNFAASKNSDSQEVSQDKVLSSYKSAMDWGNYWSDYFLNNKNYIPTT